MMSVLVPSERLPSSAEDMPKQLESGSDTGKSVYKRKRKNRRTRRQKCAPYSAKNFLGRPKINAPANTTQFLFDDKELGLGLLFDSENEYSDQTSVHLNTSSESDCFRARDDVQQAEGAHTPVYDTYNTSEETDRFHQEQFEHMYNDVRTEMLRQETADSLTNRCMELETAIHSFRFLLQKETEKNRQVKEVQFLKKRNAQLEEENAALRSSQQCDLKTVDTLQENAVTSSH